MGETKGADSSAVFRGNIDKLIAKVDAERGLDLSQYRRPYLERRLAARLRSLDLHSYRQYVDYLDREPGEYARLLDTLTINVTEFFRDASVYRVFRERVIPELIAMKPRGKKRLIRVWSAGCATGEEAYSIAMSVIDALKGTEGFMVNVLATDIDDSALRVARAARYEVAQLRHIPSELQVQYTQVEGDTFVVKPEVTRTVRFRHFNLFEDKPIGVADVVFCRNVFIYFDRERQDRIIDMFYHAIPRGGYLVLGRSERLSPGAASRFELVNGRERVYRKPLARGAGGRE